MAGVPGGHGTAGARASLSVGLGPTRVVARPPGGAARWQRSWRGRCWRRRDEGRAVARRGGADIVGRWYPRR